MQIRTDSRPLNSAAAYRLERFFSAQEVQTVCVAHPAFYSKGTVFAPPPRVKLTTDVRLVPTLRMYGAVPVLPQYTYVTRRGITVHSLFYGIYVFNIYFTAVQLTTVSTSNCAPLNKQQWAETSRNDMAVSGPGAVLTFGWLDRMAAT